MRPGVATSAADQPTAVRRQAEDQGQVAEPRAAARRGHWLQAPLAAAANPALGWHWDVTSASVAAAVTSSRRQQARWQRRHSCCTCAAPLPIVVHEAAAMRGQPGCGPFRPVHAVSGCRGVCSVSTNDCAVGGQLAVVQELRSLAALCRLLAVAAAALGLVASISVATAQNFFAAAPDVKASQERKH